MNAINKNYKRIRKFFRPIKKYSIFFFDNILHLISFFIPSLLNEKILKKKIYIKHNNIFFSVRNFNNICIFRAKTFSTKEPDTLNWIENFTKDSTFLDVGANIGIYSLYASNFCKKIYAFEPDALNYSMINLNILDNNLSEKILAYPLAIHSKQEFNVLNVQNYQFGGALSSYGNTIDQFGDNFIPSFKQGSYSINLHKVILDLDIKNNIYCKIDVDGNEDLILNSCKNILADKVVKSFLVELDITRKGYKDIIDLFLQSNYKLVSKKCSPIFMQQFHTTMNHIFYV